MPPLPANNNNNNNNNNNARRRFRKSSSSSLLRRLRRKEANKLLSSASSSSFSSDLIQQVPPPPLLLLPPPRRERKRRRTQQSQRVVDEDDDDNENANDRDKVAERRSCLITPLSVDTAATASIGGHHQTRQVSLPLVLGRKNMATWWWQDCRNGCSLAAKPTFCKTHCRPVAEHVHCLSKRMIYITKQGRVRIESNTKNSEFIHIISTTMLQQDRTNIAHDDDYYARKEAFPSTTIVSIGQPGTQRPWMKFLIEIVFRDQNRDSDINESKKTPPKKKKTVASSPSSPKRPPSPSSVVLPTSSSPFLQSPSSSSLSSSSLSPAWCFPVTNVGRKMRRSPTAIVTTPTRQQIFNTNRTSCKRSLVMDQTTTKTTTTTISRNKSSQCCQQQQMDVWNDDRSDNKSMVDSSRTRTQQRRKHSTPLRQTRMALSSLSLQQISGNEAKNKTSIDNEGDDESSSSQQRQLQSVFVAGTICQNVKSLTKVHTSPATRNDLFPATWNETKDADITRRCDTSSFVKANEISTRKTSTRMCNSTGNTMLAWSEPCRDTYTNKYQNEAAADDEKSTTAQPLQSPTQPPVVESGPSVIAATQNDGFSFLYDRHAQQKSPSNMQASTFVGDKEGTDKNLLLLTQIYCQQNSLPVPALGSNNNNADSPSDKKKYSHLGMSHQEVNSTESVEQESHPRGVAGLPSISYRGLLLRTETQSSDSMALGRTYASQQLSKDYGPATKGTDESSDEIIVSSCGPMVHSQAKTISLQIGLQSDLDSGVHGQPAPNVTRIYKDDFKGSSKSCTHRLLQKCNATESNNSSQASSVLDLPICDGRFTTQSSFLIQEYGVTQQQQQQHLQKKSFSLKAAGQTNERLSSLAYWRRLEQRYSSSRFNASRALIHLVLEKNKEKSATDPFWLPSILDDI